MSLSVKGSPMGSVQQATAELLLGVANKLNAGSIAAEACIFDAIFESDLGTDMGWNPTYGGVLGGAQATFGALGSPSSKAVTEAEATSFFKGGNGYQGGGAIALARTHSDIAYIGSQVTAAVPFNSQGYSTQYLSQGFSFSAAVAEAKAIVAAYGGSTLKGGVAGGGGAGGGSGQSGTVPDNSTSTTYAFSISGTGNPDEDYWTGINRLAQEVNWYLFSNGEYLYYLDGQEMIAQKPALYVDRVRDGGRFFQAQGGLTYDNTAFNFVSDHKRKFRVQRRTKVAVAQSPTEGTLQLICGIDEILGGDVIVLSGCGLGDGRWIVGQARRSVFNTYTELTLVPAIAPITEAAIAGTTGTNTGTSTINSTTGGVTPSKAGYVNPFAKTKNITLERIDMGVDMNGSGPILALGDGVVTAAAQSGTGWDSPLNTQAGVVYRLTGGPYAGKHIYVTEDLHILVNEGDAVKAGQPIATFLSSSTGCETGWGTGVGFGPLAAAYNQQMPGGDPGGWTSAAGLSFAKLLNSLGQKTYPAGPPHGTMPPGYP